MQRLFNPPALANNPVGMRSPGSRSAIPVALACLALTAATLAAYSQVRHLDFLNFDDPLNVTENPMVRQGLTWRGFIWAFTAAHGSNWHPITWLSHMLDCQVFGLHPAGHHFVNLLLHIGNTLLLFGLLKKLSDAFWPSLLVAFWFGLHPLHVESVAWVAERKDVLSTSFALLCLWAYSRYARSGEERLPAQQDRGPHLLAAPVRWKTRGWYLLALALFAVGLMAKPMLVTLPFLLLFIDYWPLQRLRFPALRHSTTTPFRLVVEKLPFFILAILSCIVTIWAQHKGGSIIAVEAFPIQNRVANAVVSYWRYIGKLLWPSRLAAFYSRQWRIAICIFLRSGC